MKMTAYPSNIPRTSCSTSHRPSNEINGQKFFISSTQLKRPKVIPPHFLERSHRRIAGSRLLVMSSPEPSPENQKMCTLERRGSVFILRLVSLSEHRFNPRLCSDILSALNAVDDPSSGAAALVTTNDGKFFSNGLDLDWVRGSDSPAADGNNSRLPFLFARFESVLLRLLRLGVPTVAAVSGHAAGAGLPFALAHDYRIMRRDRGFLYLAAVDIGLELPAGSMALMSSKMDPRSLRDTVLKGTKWTAEEAVKAGIIDGAVEGAAETEAAAVAEAEELAGRGWRREVYRSLRLQMYEDVVRKMEMDVQMEDSGKAGKEV